MKNIAAFIGDFRPFLKSICSAYDRVWVTRRRKLGSEVMFSADKRVLKSLTNWLWSNLRLTVNQAKSAAANVRERKFLGYIIGSRILRVAPTSFDTLKDKIRKLTARRNPQTIEERVKKLNYLIVGWVNYFRLGSMRRKLFDLDQWVRRRIRCLRLHQLKRVSSKANFLISLGVGKDLALKTMSSGKGNWRLACTPASSVGMNLIWFQDLGLESLEKRYLKLKGV